MNTQAIGIQVKAKNRRPIVQWLATPMLVGTLLLQPLVGYAQATDSVDTQPHRLFLPMAAGSDAGIAVEQAEVEQAETQMEAEMALSDEEQAALDDAILNAPLPDTASAGVTAASVDQIFTVTKVADTDDGLCDSDCSLREALNAAAADPLTYDRIVLPAGIYSVILGVLTLVNAELIGAGSANTTIDGAALNEETPTMLEIPTIAGSNAVQHIAKVTLQHSPKNTVDLRSGALTLSNVRFRAGGYAGVRTYLGAGLLSIFNCIFESLDSPVYADGSHVYIENSVVRDSYQGIRHYHGGVLTIVNSTLTKNWHGLGVFHGSSVYIRHSAIITNKGSGILVRDANITISHSTIAYNNSSYDATFSGAALMLWDQASANLNFVTIAYNKVANTGGAIHSKMWGPNSLIMRNSILAENRRQNGQKIDCMGILTSGGYNLLGSTAGCTIVGDTTANMTGLNPTLGRLLTLRGGTAHFVPASNSPVIEAIPPIRCGTEILDQRYFARPRDGNSDGVALCDIGSVER